MLDVIKHISERISRPPPGLPFSKAYEILLSLLIQDPASLMIRGYIPNWDIENVISHHLHPFLNELLASNTKNGNAPTPKLKLTSQVQFYANTGTGIEYPLSYSIDSANDEKNAVKQLHSGKNSFKRQTPPVYEIKINSNNLRHFVSSDWNLVAITSNYSVVNLVSYVPSARFPITILAQGEQRNDENDFLVPSWGSVIIQNFTRFSEKPNPALLPFDSHFLAERWISHLREIFGVLNLKDHFQVRE
jgi:hypothetical protein